MAIKIGGKSAPHVNQQPATGSDHTAPSHQANLDTLGMSNAGAANPGALSSQPSEQPATQPAQQPNTGGAPTFAPQPSASFLMTGSQQQTAVDQVKAQQALREKLRGGAREFYLNPGEFSRLYFLDGTLIGPGVFDTPMVATHLIQIGGDWVRFVCNKLTEGRCLCCESNADGSQPMTSQLFTVINTTPYVIQNGKNKGQTLPARLQLFAATTKVREKLLAKAHDRGGSLAGKLWKFSRSTKQDVRTGDDIEFMQEIPMAGVIAKYPKLGDPDKAGNPTPTQPINYTTAYPILTNAELAQLRPDLANLAGWTVAAVGGYGAPTPGSMSSVGSLGGDEIPFGIYPWAIA